MPRDVAKRSPRSAGVLRVESRVQTGDIEKPGFGPRPANNGLVALGFLSFSVTTMTRSLRRSG